MLRVSIAYSRTKISLARSFPKNLITNGTELVQRPVIVVVVTSPRPPSRRYISRESYRIPDTSDYVLRKNYCARSDGVHGFAAVKPTDVRNERKQ